MKKIILILGMVCLIVGIGTASVGAEELSSTSSSETQTGPIWPPKQ
jgi:hypothetical protein